MSFHSVFLVEDHVIVRNGFKELIERMGDYKVTAEFDHGKQLINNLSNYPPPDVIIMDLSMPVMDGKATMQWMKTNKVAYPVLILTLDTADKTIIDLYKCGIRGYLPKTCTAETLKKAIDDIMETGYYHNELLSNAMAKNDKEETPRQKIIDSLSEKELEFLKLVCDEKEYTYEQITEIMNVHRRTLDYYRDSLFRKFKISSKTGLVLFAIKHNLVSI